MRETADVLKRLAALETELARLRTLALDSPLVSSDAALPPREQAGAQPSASRRDLLRYGAAALGAAAATGMAASPVHAADGDPILIGRGNVATGTTVLFAENAVGFVGSSATGTGIGGETGSTDPIAGGVVGISNAPNGQTSGVFGIAQAPDAAAVYGRHELGGIAVRAEIPAFSARNAIAMYALNYSRFTGSGLGAGGFAIYGLSANGHGVVGATAAPGAAAVVGATNGVPGAYAAAFFGPTVVSGDFTVVGGAKSAAVPHPDGSHRRLYCVESPESWFDDYGKAKLVCGEAFVTLDRDFAAVVDTGEYHVFLTGYDGLSDLSVWDTSADGFRVKATTGAADGTFSWRVVAKRKDIAAPRFGTVEIPKAPTLPDVPASVYEPPPSPPDLSRMGVPRRRPKP